MRQRNDTANALHVSAWPTDDDPDRAPRDVAAGEEIDFPRLLAGFISLEADQPAAETEAAPAAKPKSRTKSADGADATEGGEPR